MTNTGTIFAERTGRTLGEVMGRAKEPRLPADSSALRSDWIGWPRTGAMCAPVVQCAPIPQQRLHLARRSFRPRTTVAAPRWAGAAEPVSFLERACDHRLRRVLNLRRILSPKNYRTRRERPRVQRHKLLVQ